MRKQDFIQSKLEETKFRVYSPGELVTTQEEVDDYAIDFAEWADDNYFRLGNNSIWVKDLDTDIIITSKELLEIFKKEKGL